MPGLLEQLNNAYFWDINPKNLDEAKSDRLIIERVINFGNLFEIRLLITHYGESLVKKRLCNLNYIDPKTLNFISLLFHIPKTKFKCYSRILLNNPPWGY